LHPTSLLHHSHYYLLLLLGSLAAFPQFCSFNILPACKIPKGIASSCLHDIVVTSLFRNVMSICIFQFWNESSNVWGASPLVAMRWNAIRIYAYLLYISKKALNLNAFKLWTCQQ
jgi:hypothetical protein